MVEGARLLARLLDTDWVIRSVLLVDRKAPGLSEVITGLEARGVPVLLAGQAIIDTITGFHVHRGVLALVERPAEIAAGSLLNRSRVAVVVEGVNDHENLGAIFRNTAGLGGDSIFLDPTCCDPLYRRSVRVSVGHVLRVPYARLSPWPESLDSIRAAGLTLVGLSPGGSVPLSDVAPTERLALMVGAEGPGLSAGSLAHADLVVRIPMAPGVDSLNVATSVAVALYHLGGSVADGRVG